MKLRILPVMASTLFVGNLLAVPPVMTYEGQFEDLNGTAITEEIDLEFSFWDSPTAGEQITDFVDLDENILPLQGGYVTTTIGDQPSNPIPQFIFEEDEVYLNIRINGQNLTPRKKMTSSGFAIKSVDSISSNAISSTFVVGTGESIVKGDYVTLSTFDGKVYKGSCPEIKNSTNLSLLLDKPSDKIRIDYFDTDKVIALTDQKLIVGEAIENEFAWSDPAIFSVVPGFYGFEIHTLSSNTFLMRYYDPFDNVYVSKVSTYNSNQVTIDNNNLYLQNPNIVGDIARYSDNQFIEIRRSASNNIEYVITNYSETGFNNTTPVTIEFNTQATPYIYELDNGRFVYALFKNDTNQRTIKMGIIQPESSPAINTVVYDFSTNEAGLSFNMKRVGENAYTFERTITAPFTGSVFIPPPQVLRRVFVFTPENTLQQFQSNNYPLPDVYLGNNTSQLRVGGISEYVFNPSTNQFTNSSLANAINCSYPIIATSGITLMRSNEFVFGLRPNFVKEASYNNLGVALTNGESDEEIKVVLFGLMEGFTDLTPSTYYIHDGNGGIKPTFDTSKPGRLFALNPTTVFIER